MMSLTHTDVLTIQHAIDAYEKKFPNKPSPSAAEALTWQAGKRGAAADPADTAKRQSASGEKPVPSGFKLSVRRWFGSMNVFRRSSAVS